MSSFAEIECLLLAHISEGSSYIPRPPPGGAPFFKRARSPTNSKLVRAIPDVFPAGLAAPESNLRGMVSGVRVAPNFYRGGLKVGQIAFSGENSAF